MNHYSALRAITGLSIAAAAQYLGVKEDTSKQWSPGRRSPPDELLDRLRDLAEMQERYAERIAFDEPLIEDDVIVVPTPEDDDAARALGLPSLAAWPVVAGRILMLTKGEVEFRAQVTVDHHRSP